jgi:hypothetical protein
MVNKFLFSSAGLENNLQTYLQILWEMNFFKFIEIILGSVHCNAIVNNNIVLHVLVCFVLK